MKLSRRTIIGWTVYTILEIALVLGYLYWVDRYNGGLTWKSTFASILDFPPWLGKQVSTWLVLQGVSIDTAYALGKIAVYGVEAGLAALAIYVVWRTVVDVRAKLREKAHGG